MLAAARGCSEREVQRKVASSEGPAVHGTTTPDAVRLHDDPAAHTGGWEGWAGAHSSVCV